MGRTPCCDKVGLKKGPWTPEEDQKLLAYIEEHGHGSWRALPAKAGLQRCGKSCRLRWTNYLRPDIKRGKFNLQEEQTIIQLHALLGNRWSAIATHLPKRTDNEIKNYWNTHLKKRLAKMGIDPVTHKPRSDALLPSSSSDVGQSKNTAHLSHMAQWESARLEAEARLVRQSKLRSNAFQNQMVPPDLSSASNPPSSRSSAAPPNPPPCLDILKAWNGVWNNKPAQSGGRGGGSSAAGIGGDQESPTSTLSFSETVPPIPGLGDSSTAFIEFVGNSGSCDDGGVMKEEGEEDWKGTLGSSTYLPELKDGIENSLASFTSGLHDMTISSMERSWTPESLSRTGNINENADCGNFMERFTDLLLNNSGDRGFSEGGGESDSGGGGSDHYYEDSKNYWNSILDLVNSSPSNSPMF